MCLITFAWKQHSRFSLIFAGNRDEYHARPAARATFWSDAPQVLGGRDLTAGGSWLGMSSQGRFAVVTNYREHEVQPANARSRGSLVVEFLHGTCRPLQFVRQLSSAKERYAGFNLICADREQLCYFSNRGGRAGELTPGVYGLSNELLDTPWPKVVKARAHLQKLLGQRAPAPQALLAMLADRSPAAQVDSPRSLQSPELARRASAIFVAHSKYGTRCSTVILAGYNGQTRFIERSFAADATPQETRAFNMTPI